MNSFFVCGIDEAGRGPLAGPVCAGAVILPNDFQVGCLDDSKKLSEKKREAAEKYIKEQCCWGVGIADHKEIDSINILQASLHAMKMAFEMAVIRFSQWIKRFGVDASSANIVAIADGMYRPDIDFPCMFEPKADAKYPSVMAASIIAKTCRDKIMLDYDKQYPAYHYAKHKGYPTKEHIQICRQLGASPIQRLSFKY